MGLLLLLVTGNTSSAKSLLAAVKEFDPEGPGPSFPDGQGSSFSFPSIVSIGLPGIIFLPQEFFLFSVRSVPIPRFSFRTLTMLGPNNYLVLSFRVAFLACMTCFSTSS